MNGGGFTTISRRTYTYADDNNNIRKMDVYYPTAQRDDKACVVIMHGGGFAEGSRDDEWSVKSANALAQKGFVVVSVDYRLGMRDEKMVKENSSLLKLHVLLNRCIVLAAEDLTRAIKFVLDHTEELKVNKDRIVLTGSSAGAVAVLQFEYGRVNASLPSFVRHSPMCMWRPAAIVAYSGGIMSWGNNLLGVTGIFAPTLLFHGLKDKIIKPGKRICSSKKNFFGSAKIYEYLFGQDRMCWFFGFKDVGHEVSMLLPETIDVFCEFAERAFARDFSKRKVLVQYDSAVRPTEWTKKTFFDLQKENSRKLGLS